ncbi:uncharacterized protein LOC135168519 isoform X2 [Diachasmimorpha longicaudata]|uniref:uncharacterized protein LOC135168519 isoform X2 n=1 Tax=Diachasmimorpha longicaudata TaxID=58733 RepID=UPI0030B8E8CB
MTNYRYIVTVLIRLLQSLDRADLYRCKISILFVLESRTHVSKWWLVSGRLAVHLCEVQIKIGKSVCHWRPPDVQFQLEFRENGGKFIK